MSRFLFFFLLSSISFLVKVQAGTLFFIEYRSTDTGLASQRVEFSETEKEKKFLRLADKAECLLKVEEVQLLVQSYRKVEVSLDCKDAYSRTNTAFVCLDSDLKAPPAEVRERKNKVKSLQLDLGDVPEGIEVRRSKNRRSRAVTHLKPLWDLSGCQDLGEAFAQLGPRAHVRCCRQK